MCILSVLFMFLLSIAGNEPDIKEELLEHKPVTTGMFVILLHKYIIFIIILIVHGRKTKRKSICMCFVLYIYTM